MALPYLSCLLCAFRGLIFYLQTAANHCSVPNKSSTTTSTATSYTTLAAWAIAVSWTLKARGLNADEIFASAGLSLRKFELIINKLVFTTAGGACFEF